MGRPKKVVEGAEIGSPSNISVSYVTPPSLMGKRFDPFTKYKTEEDKYHYRAVNIKPLVFSRRQADGYTKVSKSPQFGDLVLCRIPREIYEARAKLKERKTASMKRASIEEFKDKAREAGVKAYEEG